MNNTIYKLSKRSVQTYKAFKGNQEYTVNEENAKMEDVATNQLLQNEEKQNEYYIIRFPENIETDNVVTLRWCVSVGAYVKVNDPLYSVLIGNNEYEFPSPVNGHFVRMMLKSGDQEIISGMPIGVIVFNEENISKYSKIFRKRWYEYIGAFFSAFFVIFGVFGLFFALLTALALKNPDNQEIQRVVKEISSYLPF